MSEPAHLQAPHSPAPPRFRSGISPALLLFLAAFFLIPLFRTEIHFRDDRGHIPPPFELTLAHGSERRTVPVENGRICLLRGRWHGCEVSDLQFIRHSFTPHGSRLHIPIERNFILKLRDAADSQPSIAQNHDPAPHPYE